MPAAFKLLLISFSAFAAAPGAPSASPSGSRECPAASPGFLAALFSSPCQNVQRAGVMQCSSPKYTPASARTACNACKRTVEKWKEQFPQLAQQFGERDQNFFNFFGGQTRNAAETMSSSELAAFQKSTQANRTAQRGQQERAGNASEAKKKFQQCLDDISKDCPDKLAPGPDLDTATAVRKACEEATSGSGRFADDKNKSGNALGDLSKLAEAAGKAMQAMQPQGGQQQSPSSLSQAATSPTPTNEEQKPEIATAALSAKDGISAASVGFGTPTVPKGTEVASAPASLTGLGASSEKPRGVDGFNVGGGGGPATGGTGGGGGGGGGGGSNSTGSSRPGDGSAADAGGGGKKDDTAGSAEIGGGGGIRIVGLKPGKDDASALASGDLGPLGGSPPLGEGDGLAAGRDPASETAGAADDLLAHDGESIFLRVKQKYSLLKGAGRI